MNRKRPPFFLNPVLEFTSRTIYGGEEPSRKRVVVPASQAKQAGGTDSLAP